MTTFKTEVFMKQKVQTIAQGVFLAGFVMAVIFVEVSSLSSVSKILRAEKNYKTVQVM